MDKTRMLKRKRHKRIRIKIRGNAKRPRMAVYRSNTGLYVQLIDDEKGLTLFGIRVKGKNKNAARDLGKEIAKLAKAKGIAEAVFDRGGNRYHGVTHELAQGAREGGIKI